MYKIKLKYKPLLFLIDLVGIFCFFWKKLKKSPKKPKKILVIRLDHIGDTILTSSFIKNIKYNFPNSEISLLCRSANKPIAEMIPFIDNIIVLNTPWFSRKKIKYDKTLKFIYKRFKEYDLVFEPHGDPRNIILGSLIGKFIIGFGNRGLGFLLNKQVKWRNIHTVDRIHDLLLAIKCKILTKKLFLNVPANSLKKMKKIVKTKRKKLLINLGVGVIERDWGIENFKKLINLLINKNVKIFLVGQEKDKAKKILKGIKSKKVKNLTGKLSIKETAALTSLVDLVFGLESMNIHLAAALNKPIVYIHSSVTSVNEWGPYRAHFKVFQSKPTNKYYDLDTATKKIKEIKPEKVIEELLS